jgi:tetratricopeptide (TPR) repeat protein
MRSTRDSSVRSTYLLLALLAVAVLLAYANAWTAPFVFDDIDSIVGNASIRSPRIVAALSPPAASTVAGRPVLNLSLALNRAFGGLDVHGYHAVNILIHLVAALVLFGLVRRTLQLPALNGRLGRHATLIGFSAALLWALHPLNTEAVTYVIQRAESLMGLFLLATLYFFARAVDPVFPGPDSRFLRRICYGVSVIACAFGMATKESMVVAPIIVLFYDRSFISGSIATALRERRAYYATLFGTWALLAALVWDSGDRSGTAGFGLGIAPWEYGLAECGAVLRYLTLALWPHPLVFDYGPYVRSSVASLLPAAIAVMILVAALVACRRHRGVIFAGAAMLLALAPTSSVLPIPTEPVAEHRMYLPLMFLVVAGVTALICALGKRGLLLVSLTAVPLLALTSARNEAYQSDTALWSATVAAAPSNYRAQNALAWILLREHNLPAAESHFRAALTVRPGHVDARRGLARLLEESGRGSDAIREYETILGDRPDDFLALNSLGTLYFQGHDLRRAAACFDHATRSDPMSAVAQNNLGGAWYELGEFARAQAAEETALRLQPDYAEAHYNLANALARQGNLSVAREHYERALRLQPDYAEAHLNLAGVLEAMNDRAGALAHFRQASQLRPDDAAIRANVQRLQR